MAELKAVPLIANRISGNRSGNTNSTRWRSVMVERAGSDQAEMKDTSQRPPSAYDVEAIQALVLDVLRFSSR